MPQCEWAPLMAAAIRGHRDTVELLLDSGADLEAKDRVSSLAWGACVGRSEALHVCWEGREVATRLVWRQREVSQDGWTALMQVAAEGHKDTLVLLLDRGADPEAQNSVRTQRLLKLESYQSAGVNMRMLRWIFCMESQTCGLELSTCTMPAATNGPIADTSAVGLACSNAGWMRLAGPLQGRSVH